MLGNKPPYTTMQQLNLDWVLSKLKTLLRLVPDDGAVGQILRRTRDGAVWSDEQGGGGGGAVESVNGQTGAVVLDAADVGALPDDYTPPVTSVNGQTGAVTVSVPVQSVNGKTGAVVLGKSDVGLSNVDNVKQYSATNPPPYPVTSVNGQTGVVVLDADDVGALPDDYTPPVTSVNGQTGAVVIPSVTPTWYYEERSGTSNSDNTYNYTVNGDGWIVATIYIRSDATSDTGTSVCGVYQTPISSGEEFARGWSTTRLQTAQSIEIGTEAVGIFNANSGDTVSLLARCTKNGTKRIRYSIICFGCTLTAQ